MTLLSALGESLSGEDYASLSPNHRRLAQFVTDNPGFVAFASASELGRQVETSTATVVRFAQALGYNGYPDFQKSTREAFLRGLQPVDPSKNVPDHSRDPFELQLYQDIENLRRSLHSLHSERPDLIELAHRIEQAGEVIVAAAASDNVLATVISQYLRLFGFRVVAETRDGPPLMHTIAPLGAGDVLFAIDLGANETELAKAVAWARDRDVFTAALTSASYAPIALAANINIVQPTGSISFGRSLVAPLSILQGLLAYLAESADPERQKRFKAAMDEMASVWGHR